MGSRHNFFRRIPERDRQIRLFEKIQVVQMITRCHDPVELQSRIPAKNPQSRPFRHSLRKDIQKSFPRESRFNFSSHDGHDSHPQFPCFTGIPVENNPVWIV